MERNVRDLGSPASNLPLTSGCSQPLSKRTTIGGRHKNSHKPSVCDRSRACMCTNWAGQNLFSFTHLFLFFLHIGTRRMGKRTREQNGTCYRMGNTWEFVLNALSCLGGKLLLHDYEYLCFLFFYSLSTELLSLIPHTYKLNVCSIPRYVYTLIHDTKTF